MHERLEVRGLCKSFERLVVTDNVSFKLMAGERTALIGPNGAGKTTLVNLISGSVTPTSGTIWLDGDMVNRKAVWQRARAGIVRTFQISRLFRDLTVEENLKVAVLQKHRVGDQFFRRAQLAMLIEQDVSNSLKQIGLSDLAQRTVKSLALGQQRMVEMALALSLSPRLLLLDEPGAGLPHGESVMVLQAINRLPGDLAILLIDHDMDIVFGWAKRIIVMYEGRLLADGLPAMIASDEQVKQVYFGRNEDVNVGR